MEKRAIVFALVAVIATLAAAGCASLVAKNAG